MLLRMFSNTRNWIDINPKPQILSAQSSLIPMNIFSGDDVIVKIKDVFHPYQIVDIQIIISGGSEILVNIWMLESSIEVSQDILELDDIQYSSVKGM